LTQVADTADVDLDLTSAKFEWGTSKFVKECATKADVSKLFIFAQRALDLVEGKDQKAEWLKDLKAAVKAVAEVTTAEKEKLKTEISNFVVQFGKIMARASIRVPEFIDDAPRSRAETAEPPKAQREKASNGQETKTKPKAKISQGLTLNPFEYIEETLASKVRRTTVELFVGTQKELRAVNPTEITHAYQGEKSNRSKNRWEAIIATAATIGGTPVSQSIFPIV
jgi:hypothetical protein